jgi:hypothetical protein
MDRLVVLCLLALCAAFVASAAASSGHMKPTYANHRVLRFGLADDLDGSRRARLGAAVRGLGLDLWAEHPEWVDVRVPVAHQSDVDALNLPFTVMIDDLQALIDQERRSIAVHL